MDEIQKVLIKAGRKDLAQKYYIKFSASEIPERLWEALGEIVPYLLRDSRALSDFWNEAHAFWSKNIENVIAFSRDGKGIRIEYQSQEKEEKVYVIIIKVGCFAAYPGKRAVK